MLTIECVSGSALAGEVDFQAAGTECMLTIENFRIIEDVHTNRTLKKIVDVSCRGHREREKVPSESNGVCSDH